MSNKNIEWVKAEKRIIAKEKATRWHDYYCAILSNKMVDIPSAAGRADEALEEYNKRWIKEIE